MERKFKYGKYGLTENPVGKYVALPWSDGRVLLGEVIGSTYDDVRGMLNMTRDFVKYDGWMNVKSKAFRETVFLYNGALLESDGECAMPIPHLFCSVREAQEWADDKGMSIQIVKAVRRGDILIAKKENHEAQ